jgi:hypothetical protein
VSLPDVDPFFDNETDIWDELPVGEEYPYDE